MRPLLALSLALAAGAICAQTEADLKKQELAMLKKLEAKSVSARKAFFKSPKDAKVKKAYITAVWNEAEAVRISPALLSKDKYPKALKGYREILIADPKHVMAMKRRDEIVGIYKSLNRPVPGGG